MSSLSSLPLVDLRDATINPDRFAHALGTGLSQVGFVAVTGHDIDESVLAAVYEAARAAFALPLATKQRYERPEISRQRGYTSTGLERARDQAVGDLKEFWQVGRFDTGPGLPPNALPTEVPAFEASTREYYRRAEAVAMTLLGAIDRYLDLNLLTGMARGGNTVLRVLSYPDLEGGVPPGAVRAAAHEDINLITLLPASTQPGLELVTADGDWVPVSVPAGVLIVDTGDMMQLVTAGRLPAVTHRVVNPPKSDGGRLSLPFFVHPRPDIMLTPIVEGWAAPVRAHDYLMQRLRENGLT